MKEHLFLILPLIWALGYTVAGVLLKRALDEKAGALRIAFLVNMTMGLMFLPCVAALPSPIPPGALFWPLAASVLFFIGQVGIFMAMRIGDVTVVAPALGIKVVFVALFAVLLGAGPMPWQSWAAAFLATTAVFLLGMSNWHDRRRLLGTAALVVFAALLYGWCDVLVQMHGPTLGALGFLAIMFGGMAVESLGLIPFFREPLRAIPRPARRWTFWGCLIVAAQSGGMAYTVGHFGDATAINVIYSTRGLWSILLVWLAGHWFGNQERAAGPGVMARRLAGALLLLVAVGLVLEK